MKWLEVSFTVDGELAEAIADLLARFASGGVALESNQIEDDDAEGHPISPVGVRAYLPVDEHLQAQQQRLEEGLWHLGQIQSLPEPCYRLLPEEDWKHAWKEHHHPVRVGRRLLILPTWSQAPVGDRLPVILNPDMAFGSGTHPTTQLCLEMMESKIQPGQNIFDIGCGSGILSAAAIKLGADRVYGVDISAAAIASSAENADLNQVREKIELYKGSASEIIGGCFSILQAPLVIANILAAVILRLFDDGLAKLVEPGGFLILSGILTPQISEVSSKAETFGLQLVEQLEIDDWIALGLRK